jgi:hypothetical protein
MATPVGRRSAPTVGGFTALGLGGMLLPSVTAMRLRKVIRLLTVITVFSGFKVVRLKRRSSKRIET